MVEYSPCVILLDADKPRSRITFVIKQSISHAHPML